MLIKARVAAGARAHRPRLARFRRAAHLFDHARLLRGRTAFAHAGAVERKAGGQTGQAGNVDQDSRARELDRREAGPRRHSRYRVRGAVPATPVRRRGSVGAPRRHAAGAGASAGQRISFGRGIRTARVRRISFCVIWSIVSSSKTICKPTRCPRTRPRWNCWPGACRGGTARTSGGVADARAARSLRRGSARFTSAWCTRAPRRRRQPRSRAPAIMVLALDQRAPALAGRAGARGSCNHGYLAFEHFLERLVGRPGARWTSSTRTRNWPLKSWICSSTAPISAKN